MQWSLPRGALGYASLALGHFRSPLPGLNNASPYGGNGTAAGTSLVSRTYPGSASNGEMAGTFGHGSLFS